MDAAIANAGRILELRGSHGSFAGWLDAHHPLPKAEWVALFKRTFRFTGGEIVGEFLMSIGYLPGAHAPDCPVYRRIARLKPAWMRTRVTLSPGFAQGKLREGDMIPVMPPRGVYPGRSQGSG